MAGLLGALGSFQPWRVIQVREEGPGRGLQALTSTARLRGGKFALPHQCRHVRRLSDGKYCKNYLKALNILWQVRKVWRQQNPPPAPKERNIQTLDIKLGNRWRSLGYGDGNGECYQWTLYVQPLRPDIVARVDILLDPTWFQSPYITLKQPPFEYTADGWGSIQIDVTMVLKDGWKIKQANGTQSRQETIEYTLGWPTEASRRPNVNWKTEMKQFEIGL
jgi:hypothetical protein